MRGRPLHFVCELIQHALVDPGPQCRPCNRRLLQGTPNLWSRGKGTITDGASPKAMDDPSSSFSFECAVEVSNSAVMSALYEPSRVPTSFCRMRVCCWQGRA